MSNSVHINAEGLLMRLFGLAKDFSDLLNDSLEMTVGNGFRLPAVYLNDLSCDVFVATRQSRFPVGLLALGFRHEAPVGMLLTCSICVTVTSGFASCGFVTVP